SNPNSTQTPTTQSQVDFALTVLKPEMEAIGLKDVHYLPSNGYLVGTLPATSDRLCHKIGFISHMDTADFNAENITPQIVDYKGGDIELGDSGYILSPKDFPNLNNYHGQTLITTDGKTLLGADDKSGIAEIMTAMEYLASHPEIEHCEIRVGFGPDEEIGIGADKFDVKDFDVDFAYTVDGGPLGELQYETFSAAGLELTFEGRNVHPGTAKNQMINALQLAMDFHSQLPENERPEQTDGYQGFYHLYDLSGTVDQAKSSYIIRDFEEVNFLKRKHLAQDIADNMNEALQSERVKVKLYDQYYNMKKVIEKDMTPINIAKEVMEELDIKPIIEPIRGGTDGSKISFMGIPTPNLFAGGENMHGRFEFVSLQTMEKAVDVILGIVAKD
ncbi:peptidase T, partial [Streptococcus agalactiae]|nr:peptidase T [Streptococcus agalactiae]